MIIADLHLHSRFSRATSKHIDFSNLEKYAKIKGLNLLGTGDFQHPKWIEEIKNDLDEDENGILWSKTKFPFLWQTELSLIYTQDGRGRRIHHVVLAPNKEIVDQIIEVLGKKGRLDYDGRPIFGFSSIELVEMMHGISNKIEIIPAHCMTPWFGLFGSKGGFDSLKDCFKEKSKKIHAVETGMSADPPMLWRLKEKVNLVSFSDAHSFWPWRMGREATIIDCKLKYDDILKAIRTGDNLKQTIETVPDYGRYHYDGHRNCDIILSPSETRKVDGICPKCNSPLTIGVQYRIEELAKEKEGYIPKEKVEFKRLIHLTELILKAYGVKQLSSKKAWIVYNILIKKFGNEFNVLLKAKENELKEIINEKLVEFILANREDRLKIRPGYDGVYGEINDKSKEIIQRNLDEF